MEPQPPAEFSARSRRENLARMEREPFDVAIIGGGIVGAGVALDAAARGLSVVLVEKKDFASGTSSRSSKLIHGGLRYLQRGDIGLVRESLRERKTLRRIAPHLCAPTPFLLPIYKGGKPSPLGGGKWKLGLGLWFYDKLASSKTFPPHQWISPQEVSQLSPALDAHQLRGAFVYYDCVTDDARLVIELIKQAAARGAVIANYAGATACDGSRVSITDSLSGESFDLRATTFVSATGVWTKGAIRASKGIHVVLPAERFSCATATLIPSLDGKRFHFVIPWQGRMLAGTTDTDYDGDWDAPRADAEEVREIVAAVARGFPAANISERDVISSFAGLRPLVAQGGKPSTKLSRREKISENKSGMISVFGGKLTTYRAIAERVGDLVSRQLGVSAKSSTEKILLTGNETATPANGLPNEVVTHLRATYGGNCGTLLKIAEVAEARQRLVADLPCIAAEAVYAARHEMAMTVEDVLERRTRIAILAQDGGEECRALVEKILKRESG